MNIQALQYFQVVAEKGNLSRAAKDLHVSQPTLTVTIKKLEEELGVVLFQRSKKGVVLTAAGEACFKSSQKILEDWEDLKTNTQLNSKEVQGVLKIGIHASVACYFLPEFLPSFMNQHPKLKLELQHDLSRNVLHLLQDHRCDVGFVINPETLPDMIMKPLLQDEVKVWKKKGSSQNQILIVDESLFQSQSLMEKLKKKKIVYSRIVKTSSLEVIVSLLEAGMGHAILPERVARKARVAIENAQPDVPAFKDSLFLVYRPAFRQTAVGKALIFEVLKRYG